MKIRKLISGKLHRRKLRDLPLNRITCIRYTMTWRCNFKCISCNIWKNETLPKDEMTIEDIERVMSNKLLSDVNEVIISGGEPLLMDNFADIIITIHKKIPKAKFSITTNGYNPDIIYKKFKRIKNEAPRLEWAMIGVSLNGPKEVHDRSRGVPGSFENAVDTALKLKEFSNRVDFSFTFLRDNVDNFDWVNSLAAEKGLRVHICWTVMNDRFSTNDKDLVFDSNVQLIPVLERYAGLDRIRYSGNNESDFISYSTAIRKAYLYDSILNKRIMPCNAAKTFFHLAPNGDVYPCNFNLRRERVMGNVTKESFGAIWEKRSETLFNEISEGECMYPNGVCGDSDIYRSICQSDSTVFKWFRDKIRHREKLIEKLG